MKGKQNELEKLKTANSESIVNEYDFIEWIVSVSKYAGYRIDKKKTTLSEFLIMSKQMNKEIKMINKHKN